MKPRRTWRQILGGVGLTLAIVCFAIAAVRQWYPRSSPDDERSRAERTAVDVARHGTRIALETAARHDGAAGAADAVAGSVEHSAAAADDAARSVGQSASPVRTVRLDGQVIELAPNGASGFATEPHVTAFADDAARGAGGNNRTPSGR